MRLLYSLLWCLLFLVPAESHAADHAAVLVKQETKDRLQEKHIDLFLTDHQSTALINSSSSTVLTLRPIGFPYTNFVHTTILLSNPTFTVDLKYVVCRYFYCKQIGLKLIFPEHYFW